ncbi:beta-phosphoglucomutase [Paenibacillus terrigena]|uniref:beta-phosphoglucomutase n=1 Tax=Paenibacillus terrigena TaxID=369333 RepID=UPI0028D3567B|nr:beta-phosphoglucomutase [Paenibacillus terrigena]
MQPIKAVIFDLDGVIVTTDQYHYLAWKYIADRLNIPFDEQANHALRGVSRMESLDIILRGAPERTFSAEEKHALAKEKNEIYRAMLEQLSPSDVLPGVVETLDYLEACGVKTAIGSSSQNTPLILAKVGLTDRFAIIVDGNQITRSKPDPEVFTRAAERLGVDPSACLVVEDALAGVEAGVRAGMRVAAVDDARQSEQAAYRLETMNQLITLFH